MKYSLVLLLFLGSGILFAQSSREVEVQLAGHLAKMDYHKYQSYNMDSLMLENALFSSLMFSYISDNPSTITNSFDTVVKSGLTIAASDDGMLRIYSWDTQ